MNVSHDIFRSEVVKVSIRTVVVGLLFSYLIQ